MYVATCGSVLLDKLLGGQGIMSQSLSLYDEAVERFLMRNKWYERNVPAFNMGRCIGDIVSILAGFAGMGYGAYIAAWGIIGGAGGTAVGGPIALAVAWGAVGVGALIAVEGILLSAQASAKLKKDLAEYWESRLNESRSSTGTEGGSNSRIRPSNPYDANAKPSGTPTRIADNLDDATKRFLMRENETAEVLARNGYNIEQNPVVEGTTRKPDYRIEGEIFDCYSPEGNTKVRSIWSTVEEKVVFKQQADNIVLNLDDWSGNPNDLIKQFKDHSIEGLKEIIAVQDGKVFSIYP